MKSTSIIKAKNVGKFRSSFAEITIKMSHDGLSRDEVYQEKHLMEDSIVELLLKDTYAKEIKIK